MRATRCGLLVFAFCSHVQSPVSFAGYLILDKNDPTKILQRESRMLWPKYNWERANQSDPSTSWEFYRNCIGAMNSLHPLPSTDEFVGYYVGGDSVAGAAKIVVKTPRRSSAQPYGRR